MAVPLEAGGGTRLKILESFAAGLPVVSTPVGCEGIAGIDGTHFVVAERSAFADAIARLLVDSHRRRHLAHHASGLARERYDWTVVGALACDAVAGAVRRAALDLAAAPRLAVHTGAAAR
jgi:glycosyltransferase involved in cell wall biosynthesis